MGEGKTKYILLGLGIGIIITNVLYYINPRIEYEELSDQEIVERAENLGMITIKENISINEEKKDKEKKEIEEKGLKEKTLDEQIDNKKKEKERTEEVKESKSLLVKVEKGDSLYDISEKLYDLGLIDDTKKFDARVYERELSKKMHYGEYEIESGSDYDTIIDLLVKKK